MSIEIRVSGMREAIAKLKARAVPAVAQIVDQELRALEADAKSEWQQGRSRDSFEVSVAAEGDRVVGRLRNTANYAGNVHHNGQNAAEVLIYEPGLSTTVPRIAARIGEELST